MPAAPDAQGEDLASLWGGAAGGIRRGVGGEFHSCNWTDPVVPMRMWRTPRWKYIETAARDDELYDLEADPGEMHNRIPDPSLSSRLGELREELHQWLAHTGDPFPDVPRP